jgi:hypothetical protein
MAEQKIFPQQITVTGSTNGQVLTANTTSNTTYWAPANSWLTTVTSKNIIPAAANTYSLGSPTRRFKDLFLSGATMYLGNTTLSSTRKGALTIQAQGSATVQTLVSNSYLTSVYIANTTARTLISDRLQVANAVATYQTKSVERAALANTNSFIKSQLANTNLRINLLNTNLTGTNTAIRALDTAKLSVANATTLYATKASPTTSGLLAHTGRATISTNLLVSGNTTLSGTLVANGTVGTSGYYLRTSGTGVYWSPVSGGGGGTFTGGTVSGATTFSSGVTLSSTLTAGASVGTSGQALVSTGTGVQWGALSPGYNYSSQFVGAQSLNPPSSTAWQLVGNFTIECWLYRTGTGDQSVIVQNSGANYFALNVNAGTGFNIYLNGGSPAFSPTDIVPLTNRWNHIALVRNGSTVSVYLNGVASATTSTNSSTIGYNLPFYIGCYGTQATGGTVGFISNLRVTSTAVYTSNFTPPTSPLSAISGTSLLTCNAITPSDSSTNNFQITNNGGVTTSAVQSPFTSTTVSIPTASLTAVRQQFTGDGSTTSFSVAGGYTANAISVFVNGVLLRNGTEVTVTNGSTVVFAIAPLSGALIDVIGTVPTTYSSITPVSYSVGFAAASSQYLTVPSLLPLGSGDFTIECWHYLTSRATSYPSLFTNYNSFTTGAFGIFAGHGSSTTTQYQIAHNGTFPALNAGTIAYNTWVHLAVVRSSGTITLYINGVSVGSFASSVNLPGVGSNSYIGTSGDALSTGLINGYLSNFRVVVGKAVYTNNFTVPTSPLQAVQSASGAYIQAITGTQTSLLTCNGPTIIDGSTNAFTITNNGSAPVSTAIVPTFTNVTINNPSPYYTASYLAVGGGGSGGPYGGGGGAGGFLIGSTILIQSTIYNIVIGAGGAAMPSQTVSGSLTNGNAGTFTSFTSIFSSITAAGGGYGSTFGNIGGNGSSGGGSGLPASTTVPNAGGSGINGQGYAGGGGLNGASNGAAGGGGGGGGVGGTVISPGNIGGAGGVGLVSSITGSSVYYAGGGGGGTYGGTTAAAGGNGGSGGGGGGSTYASGTQGTAGSNGGNPGTSSGGGGAGGVNTGGGGGGGGFGSPTYQAGGAGGSGVVIISVPTANYTARTTGSPTVTTNGIYTVLTFTASGTYTA